MVLMININAQKITGQFKFGKVPETSKYTKHVFLLFRIITNMRGINGKSL
jgi:hypothetical protein